MKHLTSEDFVEKHENKMLTSMPLDTDELIRQPGCTKIRGHA